MRGGFRKNAGRKRGSQLEVLERSESYIFESWRMLGQGQLD